MASGANRRRVPMHAGVLALLMSASLVACSKQEAAAPAPAPVVAAQAVEGSAAPAQPEAPAPTVEAVAEGSAPAPTPVASVPGSLDISGDRDSFVYLNGMRIADEVPLTGYVMAPGRYTLQMMYADGRELSNPRAIRVVANGHASVFVRYNGVLELPVRSNAPPAPAQPDAAPAEAVEGSAAPAVAEGSDVAAPQPVAEGSDAAGEAVAAVASAILPEFAPWPTIVDGQAGTVLITSQPSGARIYLNRLRTELVTPVEVQLPYGEAALQVFYADERLSIQQRLDVSEGANVQLFFDGAERAVLQNRRTGTPNVAAGDAPQTP